jgi:hypothetical protein
VLANTEKLSDFAVCYGFSAFAKAFGCNLFKVFAFLF